MTGRDARSQPAFDDLSAEALSAVLGGRPVRAYPAMLSTEADAIAWARSGGDHGAVVAAGYQASPRGRAGLPWSTPTGRSLGFSMLLRPSLAVEREGWLYLAATCAVADVVGGDATIAWPDTVHRGDDVAAQVGVQSDAEGDRLQWAVLSVVVPGVVPPRGPLLAGLLQAIDRRMGERADEVTASARDRCQTLGHRVAARVIPVGPRGIVVTGMAVDLDDEGSLVIETDAGRRQPVRPQDLGTLDRA